MSYTCSDLMRDMENIGIDGTGTLFVHSSIKAVGDVEGGGETILDALIAYMKDGLLVLPTHTWEQITGPGEVFDPLTEPSCVGMLTNLFMRRPGTIRSIHPTHSMAALGSDAAAFVAGEQDILTPCGRDGCYGKLLDRHAQILFLGCSLKCNTFLHAVEEWAGVPDRITPTPVGYRIRMPDGNIVQQAGYRHHSVLVKCVSDNYDKMEKPLLRLGIATEGVIGDARCVLCGAAGMNELVMRLLAKDAQLFADDAPIPEELFL